VATTVALIGLGIALAAAVAALVGFGVSLRRLRPELAALRETVATLAERPVPGPGDAVMEYLEQVAESAHDAAYRAEEERDRLAGALDASLDAVVVVDPDGQVVRWNTAAERFRDARHADLLAQDAIYEVLDRARKGETTERELQLFGPPRRVLFVRSAPLRDPVSDELIGGVAVIRDVTETRRVEQVRRDFVANVSHELKTPIGALALLADTMAGTDDRAVLGELAVRVQREADRLARLVDDLLDLSLIESQEAPVREPVPVAAIVLDAQEQVRTAAAQAGVPLSVEVPGHLTVSCDRRQLVSAVMNLLDNAVKYSEAGQPVEVRAREADGFVAITVRDHGIGIPSRDIERIFERFYRVDRARSRATGGTGLGLAIVRHVAQAHGGDVSVESREGEGSTFRLRIPAADVGSVRAGPAEHAGEAR